MVRLEKENKASDFFEMFLNTEEYQNIQKKLDQGDTLCKEEWQFVLSYLHFITVYYSSMQGKPTVKGKILYWCNKCNMLLCDKESPLHTEYYKTVEMFSSFDKDAIITRDLFTGEKIILSSFQEDDLKILLSQHKEASIFHQNRDAYIREFIHSDIGELSPNAKLFLHAYRRAFDVEREIVKQYSKKDRKKVYFLRKE